MTEKVIVAAGQAVTAVPDACFQALQMRYPCATCKRHPMLVHIPTAHTGFYCGKCCPACKSPARKPRAARGPK